MTVGGTGSYKKNLCLTDAEHGAKANADIVGIDLSNQPLNGTTYENIVYRCHDFITVVTGSEKYTNIDVYNESNNNWIKHPAEKFEEVECPEFDASHYYNG